jgi:uncharacterized protein with NRDE domain
MCTLILLRGAVNGYPLVLMVNRDEAYGRISEGPRVRRGKRLFVSPLDLRAGGTWIGVNDAGLVVAISNRHEGEFDSARRSRGLLCLQALDLSSASEVREFVEEEVKRVDYNPFNLLYCDKNQGFVTHHGLRTMTVELQRDQHILTNLDVDDVGHPRVRRARELVQGQDLNPLEAAISLLMEAAKDHESRGGQSICLHKEGSGTVSSTILAISETFPRDSVFLYSDGPPCETSFEDFSSLFEELTG